MSIRELDSCTMVADIVTWMNKVGHYPSPETAALYRGFITDELRELVQAEVDGEGEAAEFKELMDVLWVLIGYARARGWPISKGFNEVSYSNYSKFTVVDGELKVVRRDDGKILKPETYVEADMQSVLNNKQEEMIYE